MKICIDWAPPLELGKLTVFWSSGPGPWHGVAGVALEVEEDASQCVAPSALQSLL